MENQTIQKVEAENTMEENKTDQQAIEPEIVDESHSKSDENTGKVEIAVTEETISDNLVEQETVESDKNICPPESGAKAPIMNSTEKDKSEEIEMTESTEDRETIQSSAICKEEPSDIEMELAEDFTRKKADLTVTPNINVKKEKGQYQDQVAENQQIESQAIVQIANSSLSLLSQYISSDSESDSNITDSEEELPKENYTGKDSSSDSSDDDEVECLPNTADYRDQAILVSDAETMPNGEPDGSDKEMLSSDDEEQNTVPTPVRAKGELLIHELPPIEELNISVPESECKPVGKVQSIVAQIVIVQSYPGIELFNLDTVLFLEKGKRPLGKIFDVIGQVAAPMYCVLFNSRQDVIAKGITEGTLVYCAPQTEHTSFIILSDLMRHRGSDASWLDDHEAPAYALDYSDDEEERRARGRGRCSSGRQTPEGGGGGGGGDDGNRRPYNPRGRGRGRGYSHRGHHNVHHNWYQMIPPPGPSQRVLNPFAMRPGFPQYFAPPQGPPFNQH
ncbi:H/ACA ribonucleoprotein complex non-core subunit NAF1 [Toxorhynchites rutilus septentrionalis]|uniref:H/ACA ribonucleoprotein complex non-core subunit NAF1 n=1 Tax=Toxorhynchites rutilus septentrionalis TaxID=329112 RepID=UPI00247A561E|nr:H/ACA ribonucleoprotein complex non-core subunit NAF1 [Toxorhynchites rutilus septentrionalis]